MKFIMHTIIIFLFVTCLSASEVPDSSPEKEPRENDMMEISLLSGKGKPMIAGKMVTTGDLLDAEALAELTEQLSVEPSTTRVPASAGKKGWMEITKHDPLMYLELREDGSLVPKTVSKEKWPGFWVELVVQPVEGEEAQLQLNCSWKTNTLVSRRPIPGVLIDGGYPIITVNKLEVEFQFPFEEWVVVGTQKFWTEDSDDVEYLMVLIRVSKPQ